MKQGSSVIAKIKKCLALSKSSNEHEAAVALRQAQKLMQAHNVTDADVLIADVNEWGIKSSAKMAPAKWESHLTGLVAKAFGCELIFTRYFDSAEWVFIGCGSAPEIARYAFNVLLRQAKKDRADYIKSLSPRCKTSTKTMRADGYCEGWVYSVQKAVEAFANKPENTAAIDAYMAKKYSIINDLKSRDRTSDRKDHNAAGDFFSGMEDGKNAQLHRGMNGAETQKALECAL